jgi:DNA-binding beta-propeller fold protein YncE
LYVSEEVGRVEIYAAGSTSPRLTLSQGLTYANDAVTDADGNVYVANSGGSIADVVVYPAGQTTPSETITSGLFSRPYGEVFDPSGDLYVADWNTGVCMIAAGSQQVVSLGLKGGG